MERKLDTLDELFTFPIMLADGMTEMEKLKKESRFGTMSNDNDEGSEMELVRGETSVPYYYFLGVSDRWLPNKESFELAKQGRFNACNVMFAHIGTYVVPWTKEKFKNMLKKFIEDYEGRRKSEPASVTAVPIIMIPPDKDGENGS